MLQFEKFLGFSQKLFGAEQKTGKMPAEGGDKL